MRVPVLSLVVAWLASLPLAADAQTLSNGLVTARFGASGLTALADEASDTRYGFFEDGFSVTVGGTKYPPATPPARKAADAQRVTYTWNPDPPIGST
jgi:hypothetical protein